MVPSDCSLDCPKIVTELSMTLFTKLVKLQLKRRDENDKLFSIKSPRIHDPENQVNRDFFFESLEVLIPYKISKLLVKLHYLNRLASKY